MLILTVLGLDPEQQTGVGTSETNRSMKPHIRLWGNTANGAVSFDIAGVQHHTSMLMAMLVHTGRCITQGIHNASTMQAGMYGKTA